MSSQFNPSYIGPRHDILSLVPNDALRILDLGCSNGSLGMLLKENMPQRIVMGIEMDGDLFNVAKTRLDLVLNADLNTFEWEKHFLPASLDCIIFADVLEHLIEPWKVLSSSVEYLSSKGSIIISVPNIRHVSAMWSIIIDGTFPRRERGIYDKTHLRWFTRSDIVLLCNQAGLKCEKFAANYRIADKPDSKINGYFRFFAFLTRFKLFNEFFAYQHLVKAIKP